MKLIDLLERARNYPVFDLEDCRKWFPRGSRATTILQLSNFAKDGKITRVRRGLYLLPGTEGLHPFVIASRIDPESCISLESVLAQAGIIPETMFGAVAITTGKTRQFTIQNYGSVRFRHEKPSLNFGWSVVRMGQYAVRVASTEKALLDLLWFHRFEADLAGYVHELRLTIPKTFSWTLFKRYCKLYEGHQMDILAEQVINIHHDHTKTV